MKLISVWNEKMRFLATTENHTIPIDTSLPFHDIFICAFNFIYLQIALPQNEPWGL